MAIWPLVVDAALNQVDEWLSMTQWQFLYNDADIVKKNVYQKAVPLSETCEKQRVAAMKLLGLIWVYGFKKSS